MSAPRVTVIGAGAWGTVLANLLAKKDVDTTLWAYEPEVVESIGTSRRNALYLPDVSLDPRLRASSSLEESLEGAGVVVAVVPSHVYRGVMSAAASYIAPDALVVSASKGIETATLQTMDGVLAEVLSGDRSERTAFLSGPSFALEVAREQPAAVTVASRSAAVAERAQELFQTDYFRVYTSSDVVGVEIGGALKNVVAIAAGVVEGLGLGHNAQAALITRGLAEITRLGVALGAAAPTFAGLAGMGDLILTCTGALSRNRSVGVELGLGRRLEEILAGTRQVAEGVRTTESSLALARRTGVEMPIVEAIHDVLFDERDPREALDALMTRPPGAEAAC